MEEHEFKRQVERRSVDDSTSFVIESDSVDLDQWRERSYVELKNVYRNVSKN